MSRTRNILLLMVMLTTTQAKMDFSIDTTWNGGALDHTPVKLALKGQPGDSLQIMIQAPIFNDPEQLEGEEKEEKEEEEVNFNVKPLPRRPNPKPAPSRKRPTVSPSRRKPISSPEENEINVTEQPDENEVDVSVRLSRRTSRSRRSPTRRIPRPRPQPVKIDTQQIDTQQIDTQQIDNSLRPIED